MSTALAGDRLHDARVEALFAAPVTPSDAPNPARVNELIHFAWRRFGVKGCTRIVATEFGDHPDIACPRMAWAISLVDSCVCLKKH